MNEFTKCPIFVKLNWCNFQFEFKNILVPYCLNSQSASISDKDAITPLVIGGVFWFFLKKKYFYKYLVKSKWFKCYTKNALAPYFLNSQSASISDKDAITPLVIGGVFWSLFSYDFDDFPQAEFHQTSNLVTVPIFKNLYYLRFTQPVRQLHRMKSFHQVYQNCQDFFWFFTIFTKFLVVLKVR